ncbi:MAG TPA: hypothetical protein PLM91_02585 [Bacillota bacterium]|mgnify:CR=1 FL=1|nr:hypothetical protein [Bacillota bacterium]HOL51074.1 hypothetical protein [Bacillota bacterium]
MKRVINGLRLAACIAVVVLLFTTTSGCLGGVISQPYSVSGKITDPDGNGSAALQLPSAVGSEPQPPRMMANGPKMV